MTTDNTAHPAPTPAPVAVPEGGFPQVRGYCPACGGESLYLAAGGYVTCSRLLCDDPVAPAEALEHRSEPVVARTCSTCGRAVMDSGVCAYCESIKPEPVVAPLPSEAMEVAWGVFRDGPDYQPTDRYDVRSVFKAGFKAGHLVPEDDEDTVRVRIAQAIQNADRKRLDRIIDRAPVEDTRHLVDIVLTQAAHIARGTAR